MGTNIEIGMLRKGPLDLITDVAGVKVGHATLDDGAVKTGVTVIVPHEGNLFQEKLVAGVAVINGFGKSVGLMQIDELGTLETPIVLTNTLSVGTMTTALVKYMLTQDENIGRSTSTVNPVVMECNDGKLNDIRTLNVREEHLRQALDAACVKFDEGAVGAGTGMVCYGMKGGVGSASRIVRLDDKDFTVGVLVLSNFGSLKNFVLNGRFVGREIEAAQPVADSPDKGSIIMIIAADIPLSARQLKRVARRAAIALGRTGSYMGNGSGDICLAFSTANRVMHYEKRAVVPMNVISENSIDRVFRTAIEATEAAILSSLLHGRDMMGQDGKEYLSLNTYLRKLDK